MCKVMEDLIPKHVFTFLDMKLSQESRRCNMRLFLSLRQRKFMSAFRALGHFTLYRRWTTRTSKCSSIHYVEGETAFRAIHYVSQLRTHSLLFSLTQHLSEILKTFLRMLIQFNAEILTTSKTIKYSYSMHMNNCLSMEKTSLGRAC